METCKICGKKKRKDVRLPCETFPELDIASFENDEEISRFLYRLTQEIIDSKDFSDNNINRLCAIHLNRAKYPNKKRLHDVIDDLKVKLNVNPETEPNSVHLEHTKQTLTEKKLSKSKKYDKQDKQLSAQSFINVPEILLKEKRSSISTITSYEFTSLEASEPLHQSEALATEERIDNAEASTMMQQIFLKHSPPKHREESSKDSSFDALTKIVATSRNK
ncbi:uncharacterized protein LOC131259210 [Anopheles coustani]|uniref:uncharacterized protein LOC131259210 n=1 Tax=Anopheles coustani TaxID=139045 RepID=UPI00265875D1|nr:uncharacterized protein LOC131259210 [Anopheles coustani]